MRNRKTYLKNVFVPGMMLSGLTGVLTGALIFFYKWCAELLSERSGAIYAAVRENPWYIPLMLLCLAAMGAVTSVVIKGAPAVRGGGIPTAEGILRGLLTFKWLRTLVSMLVNSFIGFFAGLPLGNEGPSVLMGTAIGRGTGSLIGRAPAWDRYVMTGGAAAGFAVATGAPVTGVVFALEEAHKRFSPMILMVALSAVTCAYGTAEALGRLFHRSTAMFDIYLLPALPLRYIWLGAAAGLAAALAGVLFVKGFALSYKVFSERLTRVPHAVKLAVLFVLVGAVALILPQAAGSGHSVIESLLDRKLVWTLILALLLVKIVLILLSGGAGATGGLFIPVLTVGALTGALVAEAAVALGLPEWCYAPVVAVTIAAFLGGTLRAPLTALAFFMEALGGIRELLPAVLAVTIAYAVLELLDVKPLYDIVLKSKLVALYGSDKPGIYELGAVVGEGAFVIGKTTRDVFWPPNCLVLQVTHTKGGPRMDEDGEKVLRLGDTLRLRVQTYDLENTKNLISALINAKPELCTDVKESN